MVWLMPQSVSVPEKTLEHWSSQYVTYRYRSKAALWWPASGEDIDLGWLPTRPGKAVQLELKTTTVAGVALHDVLVDLGQLWEYRQRPLGHQPFYAFPWPDWSGSLKTAADAERRAVTELGFARSGSGWWFADWMVLLTSAQVAAVLHHDLVAHGTRSRGTKKRLVRFDLTHSTITPMITWGSGAASPTAVSWREFWPTLEQCGRVGWPQLIRLPARITRVQRIYRPSHVTRLLQEAGNIYAAGQGDNREPLVTLEPDEDGNYRIAPAFGGDPRESRDDETDQASDGDGDGDNRLIVFLDARVLHADR
jgi:hypothetical protein